MQTLRELPSSPDLWSEPTQSPVSVETGHLLCLEALLNVCVSALHGAALRLCLLSLLPNGEAVGYGSFPTPSAVQNASITPSEPGRGRGRQGGCQRW